MKRFLITCGGSGGHINPGLAIATSLKEYLPDSEFLFVGGAGNIEEELVPKAGYKLLTLTVDNLRRSIKPAALAHNAKSAVNLVQSLAKAKKIIRDFNPDVAIGTGGYVCYPVLKVAAQMGVPTIIHESNVAPGLATKMLAKSATLILLGFEAGLSNYTPDLRGKLRFTGTPVRSEFRTSSSEFRVQSSELANGGALPRQRQSSQSGNNTYNSELRTLNPELVLSFWGSLGAKYMNERVAKFAALNEADGAFNYIHAWGKNGELDTTTYTHSKIERYIYNMPQVMTSATLVICRAGASTLSELAAAGKPSILIPSPHVAGNHQEPNARWFEERGAAIVLREADATPERLYALTRELLSEPDKLQSMSNAARSLDTPNANGNIVGEILGVLDN